MVRWKAVTATVGTEQIGYLGDVLQYFGRQRPGDILQFLQAKRQNIDDAGIEMSHFFGQQSGIFTDDLGQTSRNVFDGRLFFDICINRTKVLALFQTANGRQQAARRIAAQVSLGRVAGSFKTVSEAVTGNRLHGPSHLLEVHRLRRLFFLFDGHDAGQAASQKGRAAREENDRSCRDPREAAAEIDPVSAKAVYSFFQQAQAS